MAKGFVSSAQRQKLATLVSQGKFSQALFDKMDAATNQDQLPARKAQQFPKAQKLLKVKVAPVIK